MIVMMLRLIKYTFGCSMNSQYSISKMRKRVVKEKPEDQALMNDVSGTGKKNIGKQKKTKENVPHIDRKKMAHELLSFPSCSVSRPGTFTVNSKNS